MTTLNDLVRLSQVRDATGVSIHNLQKLIAFGVLDGVQRRNSLYFRPDAVPSRADIIAATRRTLAEHLTRAAEATDRIRAEYEAIGNDARDMLEQLNNNQTPAKMGSDLSMDGDTTAWRAAQDALSWSRMHCTWIHSVLVEITGHDNLAWAN